MRPSTASSVPISRMTQRASFLMLAGIGCRQPQSTDACRDNRPTSAPPTSIREEDYEADVPADPFDLGAVSESVPRASAHQSSRSEGPLVAPHCPASITVVRGAPPPPLAAFATNCIVPLYTRRIRLKGNAPAGCRPARKRGCTCTTRTSPVCASATWSTSRQQRAGRLFVDPGRGLRLGVPGESTDHAQVQSRVVAETRGDGLIDGPDAIWSVTFAPEGNPIFDHNRAATI